MSRIGKIARLPRLLRDEVNRRLDDGRPGVQLVEWLNGLEETQIVLRTHFGGRPVNVQNLSDWRRGGYREWLARRDFLEQATELSAETGEHRKITEGRLTEDLSTAVAVRYASILAGWNGEVTDEFKGELRILHDLCVDITAIRRAEISDARLEFRRELEETGQRAGEQGCLEAVGPRSQTDDTPATHNESGNLGVEEPRESATGGEKRNPGAQSENQGKSRQIKVKKNSQSEQPSDDSNRVASEMLSSNFRPSFPLLPSVNDSRPPSLFYPNLTAAGFSAICREEPDSSVRRFL